MIRLIRLTVMFGESEKHLSPLNVVDNYTVKSTVLKSIASEASLKASTVYGRI